MSFEMNCCWIAFLLGIVNLISLAVFFNYSLRINGKDKAILFSSNKEALPINLKELQTNYHSEESEQMKKKLSKLEENINQLLKKQKDKNE